MKNKIQITFKNHLRALKWLFLYILLSLILMIYFYIESGTDGLFIIMIIALPQILPTVYLHLKYYYINKSDVCLIYEDKLEIINSNTKSTYSANDITEIVIYKSANKDGIPFLTFESYYYTNIILKNGNSIALTSLLDSKIEEKLKMIKGVIFRTVSGLSYFPNW
jgi:hypothetical protein